MMCNVKYLCPPPVGWDGPQRLLDPSPHPPLASCVELQHQHGRGGESERRAEHLPSRAPQAESTPARLVSFGAAG